MRKLMFLALLALAGSIGIDAAPAGLTLRVPGLSQPVDILRDRWGLNHIFAQRLLFQPLENRIGH